MTRRALPLLFLLLCGALFAQTTVTTPLTGQTCVHSPAINCTLLTTNPKLTTGVTSGYAGTFLNYDLYGSQNVACVNPTNTYLGQQPTAPFDAGTTSTCSSVDPNNGRSYTIVLTMWYHGYRTRVGTRYQVDSGSVSFTE